MENFQIIVAALIIVLLLFSVLSKTEHKSEGFDEDEQGLEDSARSLQSTTLVPGNITEHGGAYQQVAGIEPSSDWYPGFSNFFL